MKDSEMTNLLALNYALQNNIKWGGGVWPFSLQELKEFKLCIDLADAEKTGKNIWKCFRKHRPSFVRSDGFEKFGNGIFDSINKFKSL
jgi:hypothetical protein